MNTISKRITELERRLRARPDVTEQFDIGRAIASVYDTKYMPVLMTPEAVAELEQRVVMAWGQA